MEPILISCAGMDVHEKKVDVCIAHGPFDKPPKFEIRTFLTMTSDLEELMIWLKKYEVTDDWYGKHRNLLETNLQCNGRPVRNSPSECATPQSHS